ncbi:MAG TPA: rhodanese-like domain-containing protein [Candidatus Sulfotelmatobacter sp.]|nr:rhodanese-like domain-containing protein [Candidatus Sulfotelmatobacter sp.]
MKLSPVKLAIIILLIVLAGTAARMAATVWTFRARTQTRSGAATLAVFPAYQATSLSSSQLINPAELVKILQSPKSEKPLLIQVGSHVLYEQAHIPGSEYIGPGSSEAGLQQLRTRVQPLPRNKFIVIYCGCCPWSHCPNVKPADDALRAMGFTNVKVLYIADNFGADWVNKGYPVAKGE